jgi:cytoskeletal protein RodZ
MPTLGEELRRRREARGISLTEISEETKISSRFLKAIESDNFSILPGGIFTRSFIRAYARAVELDEEEAITLYHEQIGTPQPAEPGPQVQAKAQAPVAPPPRRAEPITYGHTGRGISWSTLIVGVVIAVFIILIIFVVIRRVEQGSGDSVPAETQQPVAKPASPAPQPEEPTPPQTQTPQIQSGDQLMVRVEATTGDCWLKYIVDGGEASQLILKQGQSQDLPPAQNEVVLRYGNRETLKVTFNSREYTFPEDAPKFSGEVTLSRSSLLSLSGSNTGG